MMIDDQILLVIVLDLVNYINKQMMVNDNLLYQQIYIVFDQLNLINNIVVHVLVQNHNQ